MSWTTILKWWKGDAKGEGFLVNQWMSVSQTIIALTVTGVIPVLICLLCSGCIYWRWRKKKRERLDPAALGDGEGGHNDCTTCHMIEMGEMEDYRGGACPKCRRPLDKHRAFWS